MIQDERGSFDEALQSARLAAYPPGEFVGQESFMLASEILSLAVRAGVRPGVSELDLCCGVAGPGRLISRELGCDYTGVDASASAVDIARARGGAVCRFEVAQVPPVPSGPYDVVLLLEAMLAFRDKPALLRAVAAALADGGRFAFTVEEGEPLSEAERAVMPDPDTVWLVPLPDLVSWLDDAGLRARRRAECSRDHRNRAEALLAAFAADAADIAARIGTRALDELVAVHRLRRDWLTEGRVRKFALVAEKAAAP